MLLIRDLDTGGTQRQLVVLANALARSGEKISVITFYAAGVTSPYLLDDRVNWYSLQKAGRWDLFGFVRRFKKLLKKERPDIVYGFLDGANLLAAVTALTNPRRQYRVVWGMRSSFMDWSNYDWTWRVLNRILFWLARVPDLVIFNSDRGAHFYKAAGFRAKSITVVPNGVDTEVFTLDNRARRQARLELGLNPAHCLVGTVGRLDPVKDLKSWLAAASRLVEIDSRFRFVIVGPGQSESSMALLQAITCSGLASFVQWVDKSDRPQDFYNAMDIYLSSSRGEGFPNTIAEAMACGVPCVVTDVGDSALLVGNTGRVTPVGDVTAMVDAVRQLQARRNVDSDVVQCIRQRVCEKFSIHQLCDRSRCALLKTLDQR